MKLWHAALIVSVIIAGILYLKREPLMLGFAASKVEKTDVAERKKLIGDAIDIRLPQAGEGPFPVVLQFHGCAGVRKPFQEQWADIANGAGYAAMIVNSTAPRGYSRVKALEVVCQGKALLGQERAGDILAAIKLAEDNPALDANHIVLAGWSHGGWSVMDYLTMDFDKRWPAGINPEDEKPTEVEGVILFYPYCGLGTRSRIHDWAQQPQTLALIAGADTVVNADECIKFFDRQKNADRPVEVTVYPETEHAFDDPFIEQEWHHWHNPEALEDAKTQYEAFLGRLNQSVGE